MVVSTDCRVVRAKATASKSSMPGATGHGRDLFQKASVHRCHGRRGDLRPVLDGHVAVIVDDGNGASTVWAARGRRGRCRPRRLDSLPW
jgi:hypothetical protein